MEFEKKHKDKLAKLKESADNFTKKQEGALILMSKTHKNLFTIIESIAAKEMEKDPIDYIRRESAMIPDKNILNFGNGSFFNEENKIYDIDEANESDEETNKATFLTNADDNEDR